MYKGQPWLETGTSYGSTGGEFLLYFKEKADEIFYKTKVWPKWQEKTGVSLNEMDNAEETGLKKKQQESQLWTSNT